MMLTDRQTNGGPTDGPTSLCGIVAIIFCQAAISLASTKSMLKWPKVLPCLKGGAGCLLCDCASITGWNIISYFITFHNTYVSALISPGAWASPTDWQNGDGFGLVRSFFVVARRVGRRLHLQHTFWSEGGGTTRVMGGTGAGAVLYQKKSKPQRKSQRQLAAP